MGEIERAWSICRSKPECGHPENGDDKIIRTDEKQKWFEDKVRLILTIHDELLFEVRDDILIETVPLFKDLMEKIYPLFGQSPALPGQGGG